jgi:hypothetical protein
MLLHLTPANVSFKWFVPATQEEEAKSVPLPFMSLHVGTREHVLLEESQTRPLDGEQSAVPHGHASAFGEAPSSLGQNWTFEHLL